MKSLSMSAMVKSSRVISGYTYSHISELSVPPALFSGLSSTLECKAAFEGLAVVFRCLTYYSRSHNEAWIAYQIGMLDAQPS